MEYYYNKIGQVHDEVDKNSRLNSSEKEKYKEEKKALLNEEKKEKLEKI